jgi:hypothetical protein
MVLVDLPALHLLVGLLGHGAHPRPPRLVLESEGYDVRK